jgi:TRAP-type C4-dicarboxylate transport system permease small subunit
VPEVPELEEYTAVKLNKVASWIACIILLTTTVAITLSALGRYFFRHSIAVVVQGSYYLMPSIIALTLGYTLLKGGHVGATILVEIFPIKLHRIAKLLGTCLVSIFSFFFCWAGFLRISMAWNGNEYLPGFPEIPLLPFVVVPFFGFLFLFLASIFTMVKSFKKLFIFDENRNRNDPIQ